MHQHGDSTNQPNEEPLPAPPRRSIEERVIAIVTKVISADRLHLKRSRSRRQFSIDEQSANQIRADLEMEFNLCLPDDFFCEYKSIADVVHFIKDISKRQQPLDTLCGRVPQYSSTRWWLLIMQLIPMVVLYPVMQSSYWVVQVWVLSRTKLLQDYKQHFMARLANLVLSMVAGWVSLVTVFPLLGILLKWIIIWRYEEGLYPMWDTYHTRWWMAQKLVSLCGKGLFDYTNFSRVWYYRLLGAKIGRHVTLTNVELGEWDLLDIRDGATLTGCQCRPFAPEKHSTMYLCRIVIGKGASVGPMSVIAPGSHILPGVDLDTNSSSWEQMDFADLGKAQSTSHPMPRVHWTLNLFLTQPIYLLLWAVSYIPSICANIGVLHPAPSYAAPLIRITLQWYQGSPQVAFYYVAIVATATAGPILWYWLVVILHHCNVYFFGKLQTDLSKSTGQLDLWRSTLTRYIYPESKRRQLDSLLGQYHEARSLCLRLLGATVGRRVCWPSTGPSITDIHSMRIGDDVTLGMDCQLITSNAHGSGLVTIGNGAIVADRACVLPGVHVDERTAICFGSVTLRNATYAPGTNFVGCRAGDVANSDSLAHRLWAIENGQKAKSRRYQRRDSSTSTVVERPDSSGSTAAVSPSDVEKGVGREPVDENISHHMPGLSVPPAAHTSPMHRHFVKRAEARFDWEPLKVLSFSIFMTMITVFYWNVPALSAMLLAARLYRDYFEELLDPKYDAIVLFAVNAVTTSLLTSAFAIVSIAILLLSKRLLIGKFRPGVYDWNTSSFCRRWQLLYAIEKLTRECYIEKGLLSMLTGTHWLVLFYRAMGAKIGKDCALFAGGVPSLLLTEADLIEMGDRVAIDDAGIIAHLDRRGSIQMGKVKLGSRCVLRSGSYVLCGAVMEDDCCLLEHTVVTPGEFIERGDVCYRHPAERFYGDRRGVLKPHWMH